MFRFVFLSLTILLITHGLKAQEAAEFADAAPDDGAWEEGTAETASLPSVVDEGFAGPVDPFDLAPPDPAKASRDNQEELSEQPDDLSPELSQNTPEIGDSPGKAAQDMAIGHSLPQIATFPNKKKDPRKEKENKKKDIKKKQNTTVHQALKTSSFHIKEISSPLISFKQAK